MSDVLMRELRLYHHPVAVYFFTDDAGVEAFKARVKPLSSVKPLTFCQWEIAARMQGKTVLGERDSLGCSNACISFGWKDIDAKETASQQKYCVDLAQAERFLRSKPRLDAGFLRAVAVGPLGDAPADRMPDVVHFYCDNMQSYHLAVDYMAVTDTHPLRPMVCMSSSACGGSVFSYLERTFNLCPACSGSYNSGKTERGEVNVFIPGVHIEATVKRLLARIAACGSSSLMRPGDPFPGGDICKNCPLIVFRANAPECANCAAK